MPPTTAALGAVAALISIGCVGAIGSSSEDLPADSPVAAPPRAPTPAEPSARSPGAVPAKCAGAQAAAAPLRRLTRLEYDNTIRDLLADASGPAKDFVLDARVGVFENNADAPVT